MHSNITNKEPPIDAGLIQSNVYRITAALPFLRAGRERERGKKEQIFGRYSAVVLEKKRQPIKTPLEDAFDTAGRNKMR